jgi:AcrR family transcriptional regulator
MRRPARSRGRTLRNRIRADRRTGSDRDTRARLIEAARSLFAEHGYDDVTVRDICREANASLALVNYHFGDKQGLYEEVIDEAIRLIQTFNQETMGAPEGSSAADKLEYFIRVFLGRVIQRRGHEAWVHNLIQHEMARPTAVAPRIGRLAIRPRIQYLATVIAELMGSGPTDPRVLECVGSVHGLCLIYARMGELPEPLRAAIIEVPWAGAMDVDAAVAHVLTFSLAGIAAIRSLSGSRPVTRDV